MRTGVGQTISDCRKRRDAPDVIDRASGLSRLADFARWSSSGLPDMWQTDAHPRQRRRRNCDALPHLPASQIPARDEHP